MKQEENRLNYGLISKYRPVLMAVAILLIMFCHLDVAQSHNGLDRTRVARILQTGSVGVDIFLLLSGIGLYYSYTKKRMPYWPFEKKRLLRILPSYFVIGGITYLLYDILIRGLSFGKFVRDLSFITWLIDGGTRYWYVLAICVFYLLFPILYSFIFGGSKQLLKTLLFGAGWFVAAELLCHASSTVNHFRIALCRLPIFMLGIYTGKLAHENKPIKGAFPWIFALTGFFLLAVQKRVLPRSLVHYLHYPIRGALAISIIAVVILLMELLEKNVPKLHAGLNKALGWYGGLTYELYLLHQSYLILFEYPYQPLSYFLVAVLLPTITAAGIYWVREALKKRRAHESIQHL